MSIMLTAVPFALFSTLQLQVFTGVVASAVAADEVSHAIKRMKELAQRGENYVHLNAKEVSDFLEKEYVTTLLDDATLIKTLQDHGAVEIKEENGEISCLCESFRLCFYRIKKTDPYIMKAQFRSENGLEELIENLGEEYALNAQEISYNKIKERLESQNLKINEEEIYDDNTIVLTIDLD
ncbi:hypothetical protein IJ732_01075 [bacterium]|nr:hypothetical protein [bacterium]